jgi:hypothetical protein
MCYILCTTRTSVYFYPSVFVSIIGWSSIFMSIYGNFFSTWFFTDGFLFPIKELGLLTNPSHWIRDFDIIGSYMYIAL